MYLQKNSRFTKKKFERDYVEVFGLGWKDDNFKDTYKNLR